MTDVARREAEQAQFWKAVREHGIEDQLKALKQPSLVRVVLPLAADWLTILAAFFLCAALSWWFLPVAVLVIGVRQGALNNLLHEASHKNLARRAGVNNLIGEWLCALPSLTTLARYRKPHMDHHRSLGDPAGDPDFLAADPTGRGWTRRWLALTVDPRHFLQTTLGAVPAMEWPDHVKLAGWWVGATAALAAVVGVAQAAAFPAVWLLARAVVYYPLSTFREMADHYGLDPSSWLGYTRNVVGGPLLAAVVHPHQDGYHLVHHLVPTIPFHRTKAAHRLLLRLPLYARLHNCDGYYAGRHPLAKCLNGTCPSCGVSTAPRHG